MNPFYHDNVSKNEDSIIKNTSENNSELNNSIINEETNELAKSVSTSFHQHR